MRILLCLALVAALLLAGCTVSGQGGGMPSGNWSSMSVQDKCISLCKRNTMDIGGVVSSGKCLADPFPEQADWVCDLAHDPRTAVDDIPDNQCEAYRDGRAQHFVEVTPFPECRLIWSE